MREFTTQDFIRDFLEESAEHLQIINRNLLALEQSILPTTTSVDTAVARITLINDLFRSFHTLKGLAGMVGLAKAEELSHQMESVLGAIQHMQVEVTPIVIDRLLRGTSILETIIATLRNPDTPIPETTSEIKALADLLPANGQKSARNGPRRASQPVEPIPVQTKDDISIEKQRPVESQALLPESLTISHPEIIANLNEVEKQQLQAAKAAGRALYLAIFTPSAEKSEQGQNVNEVRKQLGGTGEIIKSIPLIDGGSIRFAFLIATPLPLDPADFLEMDWITLDADPATLPRPAQAAPIMPASYSSGENALSTATVRVDLERLDDLMRLVGDLVVSRSRIADILPQLNGAPASALDTLQQTVGKMERYLRDLRQAVVRTRMVPLAEVFSHMPLAVRDLSRASGKEVHLVMEGENTEIDKLLVERLLDPLLHLARNAIIHGIESPEERMAAGKSPQGTITLRGQPEGDHILVTVADDGRGVDFAEVAERAAGLGWLDDDKFPFGESALSEEEVLELICRPGFTTRDQADLGAGRGVGMDIVLKMANSIGGSLGMKTVTGSGTIFSLRLPLTLSIMDALIVRCGTERYAVPQSAVELVIEIDPGQIVRVEAGELYPIRESSINLVRLARLFQLPPSDSHRFLYGLIVKEGDQRTALVVDQLVGLREVVVRSINDPLVARPGIGGATELGDGSVILILDMSSLFQFMKRKRSV